MSREHTTILLIEDNPGDARLIREMLPEGGGVVRSLEWVESLEAGRRRIAQGGIDLVLLDLGLPESVGLETLRRLRDKAAHLPAVVVMSSLADEAIAVQAVMEGAQDYLVKGQVDGRLLIRSIRYAIERNETAGALRRAHDELENQVLERTATLAHANESLEREIAERKRAEDTLRRLNRELRAISNCNQVLVRAEDEQLLLNDVCRIVCDEAGYRMAWVGYAENDEAKRVRPVAVAGIEDGYLAKANITWAETERGCGPTGTAIRSGASVCIQDFATDPQAAPWRETALQRGYRSNIALPLKNENSKTFGVFTIYSTEPNAFTPEEIRLLEELAGDLAFGITVLRARIERQHTLEKLAYLASIVEFSDDAIFSKTLDETIVSWNRGAERIYGYSAGEIVGQSVSIFVPPGLMDELATITERLKRGERIEHLETTRRRKDGQIIHVALTISPLKDARGQIVGASTIARDITGRKRAEALLRLKSAALEAAANAIVITDREGAIEWVNAAFTTLTGYSTAEVIGQNHRLLKSGKQDAAFYKNLWETILAGKVWLGEMTNRRKDGSLYTEAMIITPLKNERGDVTHFIAVKQDITQQKNLEEQFRQLNAELEARVRQRTAQLETANQELEAFSYSISHDLRAPLRSIDGFSRILLEDYGDKLDADGKDSFNRIRAASQRMGQLIDDLLQLSRHTRSEMRRAPVDLSVLARAVADELQKMEPERRVEFVIEPNLVAQADANLLRVVLENLLGNAWKFTGKQAAAKIEFGGAIRDGVPTCFVRDNGVGFDMAYADKLFGAFQRLHSTADFPGTGIGLATVQHIIHRHGGKVEANGAVGQGATFNFSLPPAA